MVPDAEGTTTIELPVSVRDRLRDHKEHPRQAYHEVISTALDALESYKGGHDQVLHKHRDWLRTQAKRHGLQVRIIGSRAGAAAGMDDDLDLMVRLETGRTLFDLAGFVAEAKARLPVPVHVRMAFAVPAGPRKAMLRRAVPL